MSRVAHKDFESFFHIDQGCSFNDSYVKDENVEGSYLHIKKMVAEEGYNSNLFTFDDENKKITCHAPLFYLQFNAPLFSAIKKTCDKVFIEGSAQASLDFDEIQKLKLINKKEAEKYEKLIQDQKLIEENPSKKSKKVQNLSDIYKHNICIGERHQDITPKKFLIENMQALKDNGYETLFMEHLFYDSATQDSLDKYFESDPPEMPKDLEEYLKGKWRDYIRKDPEGAQNQYNFLEIVKKAKQVGMRVVGIDTNFSYSRQDIANPGSDVQRTRAMNYIASDIIKKECQDRKWIALMGNTHIRKFEEVPGVADMLDALAINILDKNKKQEQEESIKYGEEAVLDSGSGQYIYSDIQIEASPDSQITILLPLQEAEEGAVSITSPLKIPHDQGEEACLRQLNILAQNRDFNVDTQDENGCTYLYLAVRNKYPAVVKKLVDLGADPYIKNSQGFVVRDSFVSRKSRWSSEIVSNIDNSLVQAERKKDQKIFQDFPEITLPEDSEPDFDSKKEKVLRRPLLTTFQKGEGDKIIELRKMMRDGVTVKARTAKFKKDSEGKHYLLKRNPIESKFGSDIFRILGKKKYAAKREVLLKDDREVFGAIKFDEKLEENFLNSSRRTEIKFSDIDEKSHKFHLSCARMFGVIHVLGESDSNPYNFLISSKTGKPVKIDNAFLVNYHPQPFGKLYDKKNLQKNQRFRIYGSEQSRDFLFYLAGINFVDYEYLISKYQSDLTGETSEGLERFSQRFIDAFNYGIDDNLLEKIKQNIEKPENKKLKECFLEMMSGIDDAINLAESEFLDQYVQKYGKELEGNPDAIILAKQCGEFYKENAQQAKVQFKQYLEYYQDLRKEEVDMQVANRAPANVSAPAPADPVPTEQQQNHPEIDADDSYAKALRLIALQENASLKKINDFVINEQITPGLDLGQVAFKHLLTQVVSRREGITVLPTATNGKLAEDNKITPKISGIEILPILNNPNHQHWIIMVIDHNEKKIYCFDPKGNFGPTLNIQNDESKINQEKLKANFLSDAFILGKPSLLDDDDIEKYEVKEEVNYLVPIQGQSDDKNCGIFCAKYVESFLNKERDNFLQKPYYDNYDSVEYGKKLRGSFSRFLRSKESRQSEQGADSQQALQRQEALAKEQKRKQQQQEAEEFERQRQQIAQEQEALAKEQQRKLEQEQQAKQLEIRQQDLLFAQQQELARFEEQQQELVRLESEAQAQAQAQAAKIKFTPVATENPIFKDSQIYRPRSNGAPYPENKFDFAVRNTAQELKKLIQNQDQKEFNKKVANIILQAINETNKVFPQNPINATDAIDFIVIAIKNQGFTKKEEQLKIDLQKMNFPNIDLATKQAKTFSAHFQLICDDLGMLTGNQNSKGRIKEGEENPELVGLRTKRINPETINDLGKMLGVGEHDILSKSLHRLDCQFNDLLKPSTTISRLKAGLVAQGNQERKT